MNKILNNNDTRYSKVIADISYDKKLYKILNFIRFLTDGKTQNNDYVSTFMFFRLHRSQIRHRKWESHYQFP